MAVPVHAAISMVFVKLLICMNKFFYPTVLGKISVMQTNHETRMIAS
jgi:hypothetical protein